MNRLIIAATLAVFLLSSCANEQHKNAELYGIEGYAQGTTFSIQYLDEKGRDFQQEIDSILTAVDLSMSTWVDSSIISKINHGPVGTYEIDSIFKVVYLLSEEMHEETEGAFDATLAPVIYAWGIGFSNPQKLSEQEVDSLLKYVGHDKFEVKNFLLTKKAAEAKLDFNGIAQGFSTDLIAEFLEERNVQNYMVEVGGEVRVRGKNSSGDFWRIGIDKPVGLEEERQVKAIVSLENQALATSGNYRKFYEVDGEKFPHSIDPANGFPVAHNLLSATVIAKTAAEADAIATALMVKGVEESKQFLNRHQDLEAYLIFPDSSGGFSNYITPNLQKAIELLP